MEKLRRSRRFVRFERFVFKNQLERELLIGFTEHELHELHEYVAWERKNRNFLKIREISVGKFNILTLLLRILSQTFRNSPYSHRPSGRDRRDRTCDTPLPCCQDSPLSASPGLWCSDASSAKIEAGSRTGYDWHNPLRHAWLNPHSCGQQPLRCVPH